MMVLALLLTLGAFEPEPLLPGTPWALKGHGDAVVTIAFSPDGTQLASASRDKTVRLWSLKTGEELHRITGAQEQLSSLAFSADGKRLAVGDVGLHVRVLEVATFNVLKELAHPDGVGQVALDAEGALLVVAGLTDGGAAYEVSTGKKKFEFRGRTVRFTADGKTLLISSAAGSFSLLDAKSGKAKKTVKTEREQPLTTMNAGGSTIASWTANGLDVKLWSDAGKQTGTLKGPVAELDRRPARLTGVAMTADGKRVATAAADGLVRLWSVETAAVTATWPADKSAAIAVSPDGVWVAVADSTLVKLWKLP